MMFRKYKDLPFVNSSLAQVFTNRYTVLSAKSACRHFSKPGVIFFSQTNSQTIKQTCQPAKKNAVDMHILSCGFR